MNHAQFMTQMNRLTQTYGDKSYSTERAQLIWKEVRDFGSEWFSTVVDRLVGVERYAPMLDKFAEAASKERERLYSIQKAQHTREAEHAMKSIYSPDDIKTICEVIQKRMRGAVSDAEFESFKKTLERAAVLP